jgi:hypothetical protein
MLTRVRGMDDPCGDLIKRRRMGLSGKAGAALRISDILLIPVAANRNEDQYSMPNI